MIRPLPSSTLFPYTTLFRSLGLAGGLSDHGTRGVLHEPCARETDRAHVAVRVAEDLERRDRKSTRLNSSHLGISYAVFCLKKKKKKKNQYRENSTQAAPTNT